MGYNIWHESKENLKFYNRVFFEVIGMIKNMINLKLLAQIHLFEVFL